MFGIDSVVERVCGLGFRKRAGYVFTVSLDDGVDGWLGLNTGTRNRGRGETRLNPVVGVRHLGVERKLAEILGESMHAYLPPTVSSPLRYLVSEESRRDWVLVGSVSDLAVGNDIAVGVEKFGFAFMRACGSLQGLIGAMHRGHGHHEQNAFRLPVALLLGGDSSEALRSVDSQLAAIGDRLDPAAGAFRDFARRFRQVVTVVH